MKRKYGKLDESSVRQIKDRLRIRHKLMREAAEHGPQALAEEFGCSAGYIYDIMAGKKWKHVE